MRPLLVTTAGAIAWLAFWLARADEHPQRLAHQARGLTLACYPLATLAVPWLFRLLAGESRRALSPRAYLAALPPLLAYVPLALWLGEAPTVEGEPAVRLGPATALLAGYCLTLAALSDLTRLIAPSVGQLAPMAAGVLAMLGVFLGAPAVEHAPDEVVRAERIRWIVELNPLLVASAALPGYDPLRAPLIYEKTPIGAYYLYQRPAFRPCLTRYLAGVAVFAGLAYLVRALIGPAPPAPSDPDDAR